MALPYLASMPETWQEEVDCSMVKMLVNLPVIGSIELVTYLSLVAEGAKFGGDTHTMAQILEFYKCSIVQKGDRYMWLGSELSLRDCAKVLLNIAKKTEKVV